MKPKRIILIRHGESIGNTDRSVYEHTPDYAVQLTPKGLGQAEEAGRKLKTLLKKESAFFYVSPFWRTRQTFTSIVTNNFEPSQYQYREEPRIREQEWGGLRHEKLSAEIQKIRDSYGSFYYRFPDGESCADVYDRCSSFFDSLFRDFQHYDYADNAVFVSHGMTIRIILMRWFHWTVEHFERLRNPHNCQSFVLELQDDGKYKLLTQLKEYESPIHPYQFPIILDK